MSASSFESLAFNDCLIEDFSFFVYEELDDKYSSRSGLFNTVKKQGILSVVRDKHVNVYHLIAPSSRQLLCCRDAHKVCSIDCYALRLRFYLFFFYLNADVMQCRHYKNSLFDEDAVPSCVRQEAAFVEKAHKVEKESMNS
jgi:hypothetical protein